MKIKVKITDSDSQNIELQLGCVFSKVLKVEKLCQDDRNIQNGHS